MNGGNKMSQNHHIIKSVIIGVLLEEYQRLVDMERAYKEKGDEDTVSRIQFDRDFIERAFSGNRLDIQKLLWERCEQSRWSNPPKKLNHP